MNGSSVVTANKAVDLSHNQNPQELQQHLHPLSGQITVRLLSQSRKQIDTPIHDVERDSHTCSEHIRIQGLTDSRQRACVW